MAICSIRLIRSTWDFSFAQKLWQQPYCWLCACTGGGSKPMISWSDKVRSIPCCQDVVKLLVGGEVGVGVPDFDALGVVKSGRQCGIHENRWLICHTRLHKQKVNRSICVGSSTTATTCPSKNPDFSGWQIALPPKFFLAFPLFCYSLPHFFSFWKMKKSNNGNVWWCRGHAAQCNSYPL